MRQAITTRFFGPTDFRGARIQAKCAGGSLFLPYPHELSVGEGHRAAALALVKKMGWGGTWKGGGLPDRRGYCFVDVEGD